MAAWKLDDIGGAKSVESNSPLPIGAHQLIIAANNGSTTNRRELGQRKRHSGRIPCMRPKAIESSLRRSARHNRRTTAPEQVGDPPMLFGLVRPAHSTPSHKQDSACRARYAVDRTRSAQCLGPGSTDTPIVELVDEPRPTQQWNPPMSAPRAPHRHRTHPVRHKLHQGRSRSSPNRRRKASLLSRRHGHRAAGAESTTLNTTRLNTTRRAPTQKSPCVESRGHAPFDGRNRR